MVSHLCNHQIYNISSMVEPLLLAPGGKTKSGDLITELDIQQYNVFLCRMENVCHSKEIMHAYM